MIPVDYTVYVVTDAPERYRNGLLPNIEAAVAGGASVIQYRATGGNKRYLFETAMALRVLLRPRRVPLIINDHVDLALAVDADGVHVGQNDLPAAVVRRLIGPGKLLGLSITAEGQLAQIPAGVDYVGIGPVFPTVSKEDAAPALGIEELDRLTRQSPLPVVAIGGIDASRAPRVFKTGVAGVAVVSAVSYAADPAQAARELRACKTILP